MPRPKKRKPLTYADQLRLIEIIKCNSKSDALNVCEDNDGRITADTYAGTRTARKRQAAR